MSLALVSSTSAPSHQVSEPIQTSQPLPPLIRFDDAMQCDLTDELHTNQWIGFRQLLRTAGPNKDGDGDRAFGTG
jgi:hypothetical protein